MVHASKATAGLMTLLLLFLATTDGRPVNSGVVHLLRIGPQYMAVQDVTKPCNHNRNCRNYCLPASVPLFAASSLRTLQLRRAKNDGVLRTVSTKPASQLFTMFLFY